MPATLPPPPSAPPSLDNPLLLGQTLWRIVHRRGGPELQAGTVTDIKGHYAEITYAGHRTDWIDARDIHSPWQRHHPSAAVRLASLYPAGSIPWLAAALVKINQNRPRRRGLRPGQWAAVAENPLGIPRPHPKTIARAFRWLAPHGLAARHGGRKARWEIINA